MTQSVHISIAVSGQSAVEGGRAALRLVYEVIYDVGYEPCVDWATTVWPGPSAQVCMPFRSWMAPSYNKTGH